MASNTRQPGLAPRNNRRRASVQPGKAESAYPLGEYNVPAGDAMGRHVSIACAMSPEIKRIASILVAHEHFGFQNERDVYRWCIAHGIQELAGRSENEEALSVTKTFHSWRLACEGDMEHAKFYENFLKIEHALEGLIQRGHHHRALARAEQIWRELDGVDNKEWREKFRGLAKRTMDKVKHRLARLKAMGKKDRDEDD
jgi:hypothetical protein